MRRPYILHPFILAAFPALSLYVTNIREVLPGVVVRPLLVSLVAAGLLVLLFRPISKKWRRAALAASLVIVLFSSYGHVYLIIVMKFPNSPFAQADVLMAVWAAALILGVWALLRVLKKSMPATRLLNTISVALIGGLALFGLWKFALEQTRVAWKTPPSLAPQPGPNWDGKKPDIYYIILDAYAGESALRDFYDYDNSPFLEGLRQRGFVVTNDSATNYWKTSMSLASSLNFHYVSDLAEISPNAWDKRPVEQMITGSAARRFLEGLGYRTVAFSTGYYYTEIRDADVYYPGYRPVTEFELNLLAGSMAVFWVERVIPVFHRMDVLKHFEELEASAELEGPKFVFAHLIVPHPPVIFAADGSLPEPLPPNATLKQRQDEYTGQVQHTNRLVEQVIDAILARSKEPPIIILQSDHGPGMRLVWYSPEDSCLRERFPILNAYYLPGKENLTIPQDISPVNTFRMVFNAYFDTQLAYEPNRHYAVHELLVYQHTDVTDMLDWCPEP